MRTSGNSSSTTFVNKGKKSKGQLWAARPEMRTARRLLAGEGPQMRLATSAGHRACRLGQAR
jgi:hypothetical protein